MSSPRPEGKKKVPGWRQPWHAWRVLMLAGSLELLGLTLARDFVSSWPNWADIAAQVIGYGLLVTGFVLAMRLRNEAKAKNVSRGGRG